MRTLKDLKNDIDRIIMKYPHWENLPLIYSIDSEGNEYHKIHNDLYPAQVENINEWYLELVGFLGQDDISEKDVNCICIN